MTWLPTAGLSSSANGAAEPPRRERPTLGAPTEAAPVDAAPVERAFEAERVTRWFAEVDMVSVVAGRVLGFRYECRSRVLVERIGLKLARSR